MPKGKSLMAASEKLQERRLPAKMPSWRDQQRGIPNPFARSALFKAAGKAEQREMLQRANVASINGFDLFYTGMELRQDDADVYLQTIHMARDIAGGTEVEITGEDLLRGLGWGIGGKDYERLKASLFRLTESTVIVTYNNGRKGFTGRMCDVAWSDMDSNEVRTNWKIKLDPKMMALFVSDGYTLIDWPQRQKLTPLAKWLHSFYFSHAEPFVYKVETLYQICGSKCAELRKFRYMLKEALESLKAVGFLHDFEVNKITDTVTIKRASQMKAIQAGGD